MKSLFRTEIKSEKHGTWKIEIYSDKYVAAKPNPSISKRLNEITTMLMDLVLNNSEFTEK